MAHTPIVQSPYLTDQSTTRDYLHFSDFEPALRSIIQSAQTMLTVGQGLGIRSTAAVSPCIQP